MDRRLRCLQAVSMHLLVLSAFRHPKERLGRQVLLVSMHLLVLSAFRQKGGPMRRMLLLVSMHLLVLSAFRLGSWFWGGSVVGESQCTFWCSVPSDKKEDPCAECSCWSQCTFWCSVLSDSDRGFGVVRLSASLNAPSGAQCFPTPSPHPSTTKPSTVSMHLLMLSAFRPDAESDSTIGRESQCTFWRSMLSDTGNGRHGRRRASTRSQCAFWCSMLSNSYLA